MHLLSIVIPTKNRSEYCKAAIKTVLDINNERIQLVIQDNSDDDSLKLYVQGLGNANVKYNYHPGILSFVDNFSEAVEQSDGKYVCMIGDDDGILPNIMDAVVMMQNDNLDALVPGLNSVYVWPGPHSIVKNGEEGYMCLSYVEDKYENLSVEKGLKDLIANGGQDYQKVDIPRIYHGIVKRSILDEIKNKTGCLFDGLTPDIYLSTALALTCNKVARVYYPITVSGICPRSGSADSATGRHTGKLEDAPHFRGHEKYEWDKKAPAIYSVESIWAETVLQALNNFGRKDLYDSFDVLRLDAECLSKYPQFSQEITQHAANYGIENNALAKRARELELKKKAKLIKDRIFRKPGSVKKYYSVETIDKAIELTMAEVKRVVH